MSDRQVGTDSWVNAISQSTTTTEENIDDCVGAIILEGEVSAAVFVRCTMKTPLRVGKNHMVGLACMSLVYNAFKHVFHRLWNTICASLKQNRKFLTKSIGRNEKLARVKIFWEKLEGWSRKRTFSHLRSFQSSLEYLIKEDNKNKSRLTLLLEFFFKWKFKEEVYFGRGLQLHSFSLFLVIDDIDL